jgi:hypothetical protein
MRVCRILTVVTVFAFTVVPTFADEPKEAAPIAKVNAPGSGLRNDNERPADLGGIHSWTKDDLVIRSAEDLVAHSTTPEKAKDLATQQAATAELAKAFKVESIDWNKQMVVGAARPNMGRSSQLEIENVSIQGENMTVSVLVNRQPSSGRCDYPNYHVSLALVGRVDGKVAFVDAVAPQAKAVVSEPAFTKPSPEAHAVAVGPIQSWDKGRLVIRSAEELVAHSASPEKAKDPEVQQEMTRQLAQALKIGRIDWNKQMVVGVVQLVGGCSGVGASSLDFSSVRTEGSSTIVRLAIHNGPRGSRQIFWAVTLVDQHEGEVKFVFFEPQAEKK